MHSVFRSVITHWLVTDMEYFIQFDVILFIYFFCIIANANQAQQQQTFWYYRFPIENVSFCFERMKYFKCISIHFDIVIIICSVSLSGFRLKELSLPDKRWCSHSCAECIHHFQRIREYFGALFFSVLQFIRSITVNNNCVNEFFFIRFRL